MRFDFFAKLSGDDARAFLERFLTLESAAIIGVVKQCSLEGVTCDFSITSVAPFMCWVASKVTTLPKVPDMQLPRWIRDTDSYRMNLFDLDTTSMILTLRAAYYLGESFVRSHGSLRWSVGNSETALANMPAVVGFQSELEMAPILICENLLRRVAAEPAKLGEIDRAIDYWNRKV